jgi:peptide/nickel transport system substrate-binding protein
MTRRSTWTAFASMGVAALMVASLAGAVAAQEAPPEVGPVTEYPNYGGEVDCEAGTFNGAEYNGQFKKITATDDLTVVFELCAPDPAFEAKIAFSAFGINDTDYLINNVLDGTILERPNGTGPYRLAEWRRGDQIIFERNEDFWGEAAKAQTAVLRWSSEPGQKFIELQSGAVDGIDNVQPDDVDAIEADPNLQLIPREGFNVFYVGMNRDIPPFNNLKVRQALAMGIDRQALMEQFYPEGSEVASHFTPCSTPFACEGEAWYDYDPEAARALLEEGLAEEGMEALDVSISYRVVDRAYLPLPDQVALAIADQLQNNLGINATTEEQESTTFIDNTNAGLEDMFLLGWNGDFPDVSNFLDFHFGAAAQPRFGAIYQEIAGPLGVGSSSADDETRRAAYEEANTAIKQNVPMVPIVHAGSATAWRAGLEGAHSSPLANEELAVVDPGDDVLVFMQSGEPGGLYCADESDGESLRVCEQVLQSLYAYETGGAAPVPSLSTGCEGNEDGSMWTCALREGVTFHDGATFEAGDVVMSFAVIWDAAHPLHAGRTGDFSYWGLWGGHLNPAPAAE